MRKKAFFTGGLLVLMLLLSNTAFASNLQLNSEEVNKIKTEINNINIITKKILF